MTEKTVTIQSTKILRQGINSGRRWTLRKVFVDAVSEKDKVDIVTFDDRVPDRGEVSVLVEERVPYGGRRQFQIRTVGT